MAVGATPAVEAAANDGSRVKTYAALGRRHGRILLGSASLAHSRVAKEVAGPRTGERGGEVSGHDCGCALHACDIQRVVLCYCLQLDGTADGDLVIWLAGVVTTRTLLRWTLRHALVGTVLVGTVLVGTVLVVTVLVVAVLMVVPFTSLEVWVCRVHCFGEGVQIRILIILSG